MSFRVVLIVVSFLVVGCSSDAPRPSAYPSGEISELIDFVLQQDCGDAVKNNIPVLLRSGLTVMSQEDLIQSGFLDSASSQSSKLLEAANNFLEENQTSRGVDALGAMSTNHVVIGETWKEIGFPELQSDIQAIREIYPIAPMVFLSFPGFSSDSSVAVLHIASYSKGNRPRVGFRTFEKVGGSWKEGEWRLFPNWSN